MAKKTGIFLASIVALMSASCSSKGEQAEVKEEAAHIDGRETARVFISRQYKDSLELQHQLVESGSRRSKYDSLPRCLAAFDSAFISTVRTVRPEVAEELQKMRPAAIREMNENRNKEK